ncbi:MAG: NAD(P)/FAD-dependent oxidoreductase [Desulfurococcales archaeon]|nr:NAD(P)/FAD-dependent oxidoreductase [Desulfurococcales archaeon]
MEASAGIVNIVGAGPAGSALASMLARRGFEVRVYEQASKPGLKPCGRAIPKSVDLSRLGLEPPGECIVNRLAGARLYVDGEFAVEVTGLEGFIIDRTCYTSILLDNNNINVYFKSHYVWKANTVKLHDGTIVRLPPENTILAVGSPGYQGEKIDAVQAIIPASSSLPVEDEKIDVYFDTEILGYYWLFPRGDGTVEAGVGGYRSAGGLLKLLYKFLDHIGSAKPIRVEGAKIAVGGVNVPEGWPLKVGEAAGFVLPLTGEGIRPSILSAAAVAEAIAGGSDPRRSMLKSRMAEAVNAQRYILEKMKRLKPEARRKVLLSIPGDLHAKVALGEFTLGELKRAALTRPRLMAVLLRYLL